MADAPSAFRIQEAVTLLQRGRQSLLEDDELAADLDLMADYLASDPETCDAFEVLHKLARAIISTEDLAKIARERAAQVTARARRFENRAETLRTTLISAMQVLNVRLLSQPDFGASLGMSKGRVIVTGELADEFVRIKREPMLTEIGKALNEGTEVANATRGNPEPTITIRRH